MSLISEGESMAQRRMRQKRQRPGAITRFLEERVKDDHSLGVVVTERHMVKLRKKFGWGDWSRHVEGKLKQLTKTTVIFKWGKQEVRVPLREVMNTYIVVP